MKRSSWILTCLGGAFLLAMGVAYGYATTGENLSFLTKFALTRMLVNWKSRPQFIAYELKGLPSIGAWLQRRRGRAVLIWTATTRQEYDRASQLGDNVVFELAAKPAR